MALILEDGTGVAGANSYSTSALVSAYLTERNRSAENGWDGFSGTEKDAAIIAATDYIEQRFSLRFLGNIQFRDVSAGRSTLTLTSLPLDTETVTLDTTVYTFNTALGGANSILIGANVAASILNLVNAVSANSSEAGVTHGTGTVAHATVTASEGIGDTMIVEAKNKGTAGNGIATTETLTSGVFSSVTLLGGGDFLVPQPLSFPRLNLLDREGFTVSGIPTKLLQATAEYAVRAVDVTSKLSPDPVVDATGQVVVGSRVVIGPIETETKFSDTGSLAQVTKPFPAADRLLAEYLAPTGNVIRG